MLATGESTRPEVVAYFATVVALGAPVAVALYSAKREGRRLLVEEPTPRESKNDKQRHMIAHHLALLGFEPSSDRSTIEGPAYMTDEGDLRRWSGTDRVAGVFSVATRWLWRRLSSRYGWAECRDSDGQWLVPVLLIGVSGVLALLGFAIATPFAGGTPFSMDARLATFTLLTSLGAAIGVAGMAWHRDRLMTGVFDLASQSPKASRARETKEYLADCEALSHTGHVHDGLAGLMGIALTVAFAHCWALCTGSGLGLVAAPLFVHFALCATAIGYGVVYMVRTLSTLSTWCTRIRTGRMRVYVSELGKDVAGLGRSHLMACWIVAGSYGTFLLAITSVGWREGGLAGIAVAVTTSIVLAYFLMPLAMLRALRARFRRARIRYRTVGGAEESLLKGAYAMSVDPIEWRHALAAVSVVLSAAGIGATGILRDVLEKLGHA